MKADVDLLVCADEEARASVERDDDFRRRRARPERSTGGVWDEGAYSTTSTFSPSTSLQKRARSALENSFQPRQGPHSAV